ncbi:MAG TPA: TlpA disulfide reductase family protein [Mycobacterium sp.]|nr:TlpA disulfide reductase family protein [Mycobacterium sp.]
MQRVLIRVIGDDTFAVDGRRDGDRVFVPESELRRISGWQLKRQGLCRGDACVLVAGRGTLGPDGWIDVAALGEAVGQPVAVEAVAGLAVIGRPAAERAETLSSLAAPDVRLPTVAGSQASVGDFSGCKRLVVSFASWCGCRYDLPAWQELHERYADNNFCVVAVAVDESAEAVRPWVNEAKATYPVLIDADHEFVDAYGIRNVPTVVWIDEDDRIVRPNSAEFGDDKFIDFHGRPCGPHLDALQRWILDGEKPYASDAAVRADQFMPDDDQQLARAEYRLAIELWRNGERDLAEKHFVRAGELAPFDFTIRRGSMPLRGQDPFGEPFFELYKEWEAAGRPYYREPAQKQ